MVRFFFALALTAAVAQQPETMSLLNEPLYPPPVPRAERARLEAEAAQARADVGRNPANADAVLRLAAAQRELGLVGDALETLTRALEGKADTPAVHLARGRDFVVIRKFDLGQREARKAADTLPEAHCDIAFTLYLVGDYKQAHEEYGRCKDAGMFGYLAARRAGVDAGTAPPLPDDTRAREPIRLPGSTAPKAPKADTSFYARYADAVDRLLHDDKEGARKLLKPMLDKQKDRWMEPIYVAAEADYARIAPPAKHAKKKKK